VLDSGGVTALIGRSQAARAWLRWIVTNGGEVVVPTPVLAECTTGSAARDAEVNRVLGVLGRYASALVSPGEATARLAGALRFRARSDDGIDALVAAEAARTKNATVLLTSDPSDLERLLTTNPEVRVQRV
jgi:predicted nucleic acid-binding protein